MSLLLATLGLQAKSAAADPLTLEASPAAEHINTLLNPHQETWEEAIAPQIKARDQQVVEANRAADEKAAQDAAAAAAVQPRPQVVSAPTGSCQSWLDSAGISDKASAYQLIMRESGCNPNAVNVSSGACGIGQQLPCGKWSHSWNDPVGGMVDMEAYVVGKYGSWANALGHSLAYNWY